MSWRARHERMAASVLSGLCANPEVVPNLQAVRLADPGVLGALAEYARLLADEALLRGSFVGGGAPPPPREPPVAVTDEDVAFGLREATRAFQRRLILRALEACGGNKQLASKVLKTTGRTLYNKLHELGVMTYAQGRPRKGEVEP